MTMGRQSDTNHSWMSHTVNFGLECDDWLMYVETDRCKYSSDQQAGSNLPCRLDEKTDAPNTASSCKKYINMKWTVHIQ